LAVLIGAAIGLAFGNAWHVLLFRILLLWGALYLVFGFFELLLQFLSTKAAQNVLKSSNLPEKDSENTPENAQVK
jgi:threonine/homoserine/homoserine lactone efflux protein